MCAPAIDTRLSSRFLLFFSFLSFPSAFSFLSRRETLCLCQHGLFQHPSVCVGSCGQNHKTFGFNRRALDESLIECRVECSVFHSTTENLVYDLFGLVLMKSSLYSVARRVFFFFFSFYNSSCASTSRNNEMVMASFEFSLMGPSYIEAEDDDYCSS